jgi:hypothetical protein
MGAIAMGMMGAVATLPAQAHHSFPATYNVDKTQTIQGTIVQVLVRNPHAFVHVLAPDPSGKMVEWSVEWASGAALLGAGVNARTLKAGDVVIVTGNPARDATSHRLRMRAIERPSDGWKWAGTFG